MEPAAHTPSLHSVFQIFGTALRDEETEVWFVDIAYDEIPERYYKESEVSGVQSVTPRPQKVKVMRAHTHITQRKMENC